MGLNVVAVGGAPATGKSSLLQEVLEATSEQLYNGNRFKWGEVEGNFYTQDSLVVFGLYDGAKEREGTDVLSKSANNHAKQFTKMLVELSLFNTVVFEGDRLFNRPYLRMCREHSGISLDAYVLHAPDEELNRRHDVRGDDQDDGWREGMRTQYTKYREEPWTIVLNNETESDRQENVQEIRRAIGIGDPDPSGETREEYGGLGSFSDN